MKSSAAPVYPLQRTLTLYDGSISFLWTRPFCLVVTLLTLVIACFPLARDAVLSAASNAGAGSRRRKPPV